MRQIGMHQLLYPYCDPARDSQYPAGFTILSTEWKDRKLSWIQVDNRVGDPIEVDGVTVTINVIHSRLQTLDEFDLDEALL